MMMDHVDPLVRSALGHPEDAPVLVVEQLRGWLPVTRIQRQHVDRRGRCPVLVLPIVGYSADPQLVLNMLAADQQGPADGLGVLLHSRLAVPVVGEFPDQGLVLGQPVLHALDLRNGSRLGPFDVLHGPNQRQLLHVHVHGALQRLKAENRILHDAVPVVGRDGDQEEFFGCVQMGAAL